MSVLTGPALTVDAPFARLSVPGDIRDFYDSTTHDRYKSGYVASVLSQLALTGTFGAGDTLSVLVKPPNYNPGCGHTELKYYPTATGNVFTGLSYTVNTACNYGLPGPSARLEGDQTISYVDVELTLTPASDASTSSLVPALTYTNTITSIDPYTAIGGSAISGALALYPDTPESWLTVTYPVTALVAVAVQLASLTATVQQGVPAGSDAPLFVATNVPQSGGQSICNVKMPLGASVARVKTFYDLYTYVFAINNSKVDANGAPVVRPSPGTVEWNLINAGLTKSQFSGDTASATLASKIQTF